MPTDQRRVAEADVIRDLPGDRSAYVAGSALDWEPVGPGKAVKSLFAGPDGVTRTLVFRLAPGARSEPHAHAELEQIYVLEGSFHDGERLLCVGDHCVRPPGAIHDASTEEGAVVLVMYSAAP